MDELPASLPLTHAPRRARTPMAWLSAAAVVVCPIAAFANGPGEIDSLQAGLASQVKKLALDAKRPALAGPSRVEISLGQLDPRLRLAPCRRIEPYLPPGTALWGKTRIGLRCTQGATAWNVFLPVTVAVFGKAWVAAVPLPAGSVVSAADLIQAEVNLAEEATMPITDTLLAVGRPLARALNAGQPLRPADLKARQWFTAGDEVRILARGSGFSVAGAGQALTPGMEGQPARIRVESGRVLVGMPVGERQVELPQ